MTIYAPGFQREIKFKGGPDLPNVADGQIVVAEFDPTVYGLFLREGNSHMYAYLTEVQLRGHLAQIEAALMNIEAWRDTQRRPRPMDDDEVAAC